MLNRRLHGYCRSKVKLAVVTLTLKIDCNGNTLLICKPFRSLFSVFAFKFFNIILTYGKNAVIS